MGTPTGLYNVPLGRCGRYTGPGPPLVTFNTTHATSAVRMNPRFSCMRENPGPLVAVMAFFPPREAPTRAPILEISSSIWMKVPSSSNSRSDLSSEISAAGVIRIACKKAATSGQSSSYHSLIPLYQYRLWP